VCEKLYTILLNLRLEKISRDIKVNN